MDLKTLQQQAIDIRKKYEKLEIKKEGKPWSNERLTQGFINDVNELLDFVKKDDLNKIDHEISDCLWSILVLADKYRIDLEKSFKRNMGILEKRIEKDLKNK